MEDFALSLVSGQCLAPVVPGRSSGSEPGLGNIRQGTDANDPGPLVCQPERPHCGSAKHDRLAHCLPIFSRRSRKPVGEITSPVYKALHGVWSLCDVAEPLLQFPAGAELSLPGRLA